jgi:Type II secretion system (T2SS), protein M subtype b
MTTDAPDPRPGLKARLFARMHDPFQLRAALSLALLAAWYLAGYTPMSDRIAATAAQLDRDRRRLALATEVDALRVGASEFADRLPPRGDPNEFPQYVLDGIRSLPLKLLSLALDPTRDAGPYQVAAVRVDVEGKYEGIDALLTWVESNPRLLRVDSLKIAPDSKQPDVLKVQMGILGLMGAEEPSRAAPRPKGDPKGPPPKTKARAVPARAQGGPHA